MWIYRNVNSLKFFLGVLQGSNSPRPSSMPLTFFLTKNRGKFNYVVNTSSNAQWRNRGGAMGAAALPSTNNLLFLNEHKKRIIVFVFLILTSTLL